MDESMATPQFANGMMIGFAVAVLFMIATMWRLFSKAGESGWKSLIPIYSAIVFQRILGRPGWWVLLMMVPVVNLAIAIIECFDLARVFGKGAGYAIGLMLLGPLFFALLAFGPAKYVGPGGTPSPVPVRPGMGGRPNAAVRPSGATPVNKRAA